MDLLTIIRAKLVSAGVVDDTAWKCFIGYTPDVQDQAISLTPSGGFPQDTLGDENVLETFQASVRTGSKEYVACETKWREIYNTLHAADLSASGIHRIVAMESGPLVWYDDKNRTNMSVNFAVTRARP